VQVKEFGDQSLFVRAAVSGVAREGIIAAALTALMILLFSRFLAQHDHHCDLNPLAVAVFDRDA